MMDVRVALSGGDVVVDVCRPCQLIWFDGGESDTFAPIPTAVSTNREVSLEAREALGRLELAKLEARGHDLPSDEGPDDIRKVIPAALGLPVEESTTSLRRVPWATWGIAVAIVLVGVLNHVFPDLRGDLGWIPAEPLRLGGAALLTSIVVHAGWLHLLGNVYYLVTFGDNVEDLLGIGRYLALIFLAELGAAIGHVMFAPDPTLPVVGASGGISGILAFYAVRLSHVRIGLVLFFRWVSVPAWGFFGLWLALQGWLAIGQSQGATAVSAGAHLGGAAVGLTLALLSRRPRASGR